jgi:hypothetical protein
MEFYYVDIEMHTSGWNTLYVENLPKKVGREAQAMLCPIGASRR